MLEESASFWTDIKNYEERLAQDPDSHLFARLAEVYLKVGLVDDALHAARQGLARHPGYIAGQRALALACHVKGLQSECLEALEKVTTALPEDGDAQKMLGRLLSSMGSMEAAIRAFRTALVFNPDDMECRVELEALERSVLPFMTDAIPDDDAALSGSGTADDKMDAEFGAFEDEAGETEEVIEAAEVLDLDELDLLEPEEDGNIAAGPVAAGMAPHDPLFTSTLAELYLQQGFNENALEIYHKLLANDPGNAGLRTRIAELEGRAATDSGKTSGKESAFGLALNETSPAASVAPLLDTEERAVAILEEWLDNLGRMKGCR